MKKFQVTGIFGGFRIDHENVCAKDKADAKKKFKNTYKKEYRRDVKITRVAEMGECTPKGKKSGRSFE